MRKTWILFPLLLLIAGGARAAKMVDCVLDQAQVTPTITAFRVANFAEHIGGLTDANGLPVSPTITGYEYFRYTELSKIKWLLTMYGETVTGIPGTNYPDLSKPSNRAALRRAIMKRVADIHAKGFMLDTPMETAPGQGMNAADFVRECASLPMMVNTGDPYTASDADTLTPWGRINRDAPKEWIQCGINLTDGRYTLSGFSRSCAVANARIAAGKMIVIGVFDEGGAHAETAKAFFSAAIFANPLVYGHYNTSLDSKTNVGLQLPGGKPVVEPATIQTGLLPDMTPLGPLYLPADNWWNLDVSAAPVDPNSATIIATIQSYESTGGRLHPDFTPNYGIPICVVDASTPLVPVTISNTAESDQGYPGGPSGYPIPAAATTNKRYLENGYMQGDAGNTGDSHLLIFDKSRRAAFELSYASYSGGRWSAGYGAVFKLDSNYTRPAGWTSTDAAGLCVMAGLVRYDEAYGTAPIRHAIRCSVKHTNRYVWPASHTGSTDAGAPPLGTRFRLKSSVNISGYPAPLQRIFQAMKTYGLIVADRGGNMYVQGTMDSRWDNNVLNPAFHSLHASDFEVIKLGWKPTL
jgi:hypothetical protein